MLSLLLAAQIQLSPVSFPTKASDGVMLTGTLYEPPGLTSRVPAVVILHTCAGLSPNDASWGTWFAENGYVGLVVDSFGPRHVDRVCGSPAVPSRLRAFDAYGALAYLRTLPDVDGAHVGAIGFSHGGGTVLWTENADVAAKAGFAGNGFAAAVALYPNACGDNPTSALTDPLLLLIGASDDWTDARTCERFMSGVGQSAAPGTFVAYPNTYHKFDDPAANKEVRVNGHFYTLRYNAQSAADAHDRILAFFQQYL
ncbi:MAG TPA: dienelactone hydrolase family protein [Candidatus Acidoferrum sp.]|nr:dienelactone hydrolase family protein [Candidatus Acidoferrum sp.]